MKILKFAMIFLLLAGCASTPSELPKTENDGGLLIPRKQLTPSNPFSSAKEDEPVIDYLGLQRHLGLDRMKSDLGYLEKSFETCQVGYGYSASRNCRRAYFISIHFQILCRNSEGTISTAIGREDMLPLSGRSLTWIIQGSRGSLQLDGEGYGQIKMTFFDSQRTRRLKLAVDNDFVYVRAGEVKRLVTPRNWCN